MSLDDFTAAIDDKLYFGKYPTQEEANLLLENDFEVYVDLTTADEVTWAPYKLAKGVIKMTCPLVDRTPDAVDNTVFLNTIKEIIRYYRGDRKIYIHCRGGHGRSAVVAAIVIAHLKNTSPSGALKLVKTAHSHRKIMEAKWRKMGAPQTKAQKDFVLNYDYSLLTTVSKKPIRFFSGKAKDIDASYEIFSNFAPVPVTIDSLTYPTTEHYFQAAKFIDSTPLYAEQIRKAKTAAEAKKLGKSRKYPIPNNWNELRIVVMHRALFAKMLQHNSFREALLKAEGALIVEASPFDAFWGEGRTKKGKNMLGVMLMDIRDTLIKHKTTIYKLE